MANVSDREWGLLADLPPQEREEQMQRRFQAIAAMPEEERQTLLQAIAEVEYALPDEKLRALTVSRLRAWLQMELEQARTVANTYDKVVNSLPLSIAWRRVSLVQTLAMDFSGDEEQRLRLLVPSVFGGAGRRIAPETGGGTVPISSQLSQKKPWWAFWRKS